MRPQREVFLAIVFFIAGVYSLVWAETLPIARVVPDGLPQDIRISLESQRQRLEESRLELEEASATHEDECVNVAEDDSLLADCPQRELELEEKISRYFDELKDYDAAIESALAKKGALDKERKAEQKRRQALRKKLRSLRASLNQTQEALRRLGTSIQEGTVQLAEWEQTIEKAVQESRDMGVELAFDTMMRLPQDKLNAMYGNMHKELNSQLQRATVMLSGEVNSARREQLHSAFKLLNRERENIRRLQAGMQRLKEAQGIYDLDALINTGGPDKEKVKESLELFFSLASNESNQELFGRVGLDVQIFSVLSDAFSYYNYGKIISDTAYNITAESISWRRINQLDKNSAEYLKAVGSLSERMQGLVRQINQLEAELTSP